MVIAEFARFCANSVIATFALVAKLCEFHICTRQNVSWFVEETLFVHIRELRLRVLGLSTFGKHHWKTMFPGLSTFKKYGTKVRMNQCFDNHISSSDYISIFKQIATTIILIQFHGLGS